MTRPAPLAPSALVTLLLFVAPALAAAEPGALLDHNAERLELQKSAMLVLGGWAAANIAAGTAGYFAADDARWKAFHQMNALWNVVNAGIAAFAYVGASDTDPASFGLAETLAESWSFERVLAINAGLDLAYIAAGWGLWERGRRTESARMRGWGQSIALQGGALLVFDAALLWIVGRENAALLPRLGTAAEGAATIGWSVAW